MELSLSTESYKIETKDSGLPFCIMEQTKPQRQKRDQKERNHTSSPILNNKKTTPNSAMAFVPWT